MNKQKLTNKIIILTTLLLVLCSTIGCASNSPANDYSKYGTYFDTFVTITVYGTTQSEADEILQNCLNKCQEYEMLLDSNIQGSDIYNINHSNGAPCEVDPRTISMLETAISYSQSTDGLFDVTVFAASSLWNFHEDEEYIPNNAELKKALSHIDYKNIIIDKSNNTITLSDPAASIDIGGIAKGYIADEIASYLHTQNVTGAIINLGGDIYAYGTKPNGDDYTIGINDPNGSPNPVMAITISNKAIATSGTYIRRIQQNGEYYHHILNPSTGYPADTDLVSSTIITDNATDADTLCTISILMGSSAALSYIDSIPDTEAILIKSDGSIVMTDGARRYIKEK